MAYHHPHATPPRRPFLGTITLSCPGCSWAYMAIYTDATPRAGRLTHRQIQSLGDVDIDLMEQDSPLLFATCYDHDRQHDDYMPYLRRHAGPHAELYHYYEISEYGVNGHYRIFFLYIRRDKERGLSIAHVGEETDAYNTRVVVVT